MYNRITITVGTDSDKDLVAQFAQAHEKLSDKQKTQTPAVLQVS